MATDIKKLAEELVNLTVLEVNELKNTLKDEYGIEPAAAAVAVAAGPAAGGDAAAAADPACQELDGRPFLQQLFYRHRRGQAQRGRRPCRSSEGQL